MKIWEDTADAILVSCMYIRVLGTFDDNDIYVASTSDVVELSIKVDRPAISVSFRTCNEALGDRMCEITLCLDSFRETVSDLITDDGEGRRDVIGNESVHGVVYPKGDTSDGLCGTVTFVWTEAEETDTKDGSNSCLAVDVLRIDDDKVDKTSSEDSSKKPESI